MLADLPGKLKAQTDDVDELLAAATPRPSDDPKHEAHQPRGVAELRARLVAEADHIAAAIGHAAKLGESLALLHELAKAPEPKRAPARKR